MFNIEMLDVAIGLIFVYILVSVICTAIREGIEAILKQRAAYLDRGIRELLKGADAALVKGFFEHPLISNLSDGPYPRPKTGSQDGWWFRNIGGNRPSYIPARNFALALMDIAARGPGSDPSNCGPNSPVLSLESIRATVGQIENPSVQRMLLLAVDSAQGDLNRAQASIESWFDSSMDRVSGWYKRSTQKIVFVIALFVTVALNVDSIAIIKHLSQNEAARDLIVKRAQSYANSKLPPAIPLTPVTNEQSGAKYGAYDAALKELGGLSLPIGWSAVQQDRMGDSFPWRMGLGWLMTALAATLGAPFWFDVLNRVMVIRSTVKPHEKSQEESSEDRQTSPANPPGPGGPPANAVNNAPPGGAGPAGVAALPGVAVPGAVVPAAVVPAAGPQDEESDLCGCDVEIEDETADEDLPAAAGGVD